MKRLLAAVSFVLLAAPCVAAQGDGNAVYAQTTGTAAGPSAIATFRTAAAAPVLGAPYSATITNQSIQTLADGNRIVQTFSGATARDSQGRTRQDLPFPNLGGLSAAHEPHLVSVQDPVSQTSYIFDLTNKTAQKMLMPPGEGDAAMSVALRTPPSGKVFVQVASPATGTLPGPIALEGVDDTDKASTESLGSKTMEGVLVNGTRTTRTIPAGQIGNDRPIEITTEVWISPDLKAIVYSKRTDPRMGEQTFEMTNIVREEPDAALFAVPSDFKIVDQPEPIVYRPNQ